VTLTVRANLDLTKLTARMQEVMPEAVRHGLEHIAEVSARQVPIEEGTLLRSQKIDVDADGRSGSISYGTPYARYQHERLDLHHEHGNAKFLELPMLAESGTAVEIIGRDLRGTL
jgi:hypothetical protein